MWKFEVLQSIDLLTTEIASASAEVFLFKWVAISNVFLLPIILNLKMNPEFVEVVGKDAAVIARLSSALQNSVFAVSPLLVDLYLDYQTSLHKYFFQRISILISTIILNFAVVGLHYWEISEAAFATTAFCLIMMRTFIAKGSLVSYLYDDSAPRGIKRAADAYYILSCLMVFFHLYAMFNGGNRWRWSSAMLGGTEVIAAFVLVLECIRSTYRFIDYPCPNTYSKITIIFSICGVVGSSVGVLLLYLSVHYVGATLAYLHLFLVMASCYLSKILNRNDHLHAKDLLIAKRSFVRYIAHEMRTPLNVSLIGVQLAQEQCSFDNVDLVKLREMISDTHTSLEAVVDTLNEFLVFDKVESGTLMLDKETFLVLPLLESVFKSFFLQAQEKNLTYALEIKSDLSSTSIDADKKKITQAMRNFISNALKFTPAGGSITVKADVVANGPKRNNFRFEVIDTGAGISAANVPRLFKEVVQFDAVKLQDGGGSGLGLTITKAIVEAHGGCVGVQSVYGEGSLFYLELETCEPLINCYRSFRNDSFDEVLTSFETDNQGTPYSAAIDSLPNAPPPISSPKSISLFKVGVVLLVDDSELNLKMMSRLCRPFADVIITAANGAAASDIVKATLNGRDPRRIDAILTDYHMPVMDGIHMTSEIRAAGYDGFVALVTGDDSVVMSQFHASGGNMILSKPISTSSTTRMFVEAKKGLKEM